jgi:phosphonate transport system substrate-binding protein
VVLWKTPSYPNYQITVRPDLDEAFRSGFTEDLQKVLLELPGDLCEQVFSRSGLVAASNEQFDGIEERARSAGLLR